MNVSQMNSKLQVTLFYSIYCQRCRREKKVCSFYHPRKYLTISVMLYLYKSPMRPKMEYCCNGWSGATQFLARVENVLRVTTYFPHFKFFNTDKTLQNLSLHYFHGKYLNKLHSLFHLFKSLQFS